MSKPAGPQDVLLVLLHECGTCFLGDVEVVVEALLVDPVFLPDELHPLGEVLVDGMRLDCLDLLIVAILEQTSEEFINVLECEDHGIVDQLLVEVHDHLLVLEQNLNVVFVP